MSKPLISNLMPVMTHPLVFEIQYKIIFFFVVEMKDACLTFLLGADKHEVFLSITL